MKVAAVDIGSNALRLAWAHIDDVGVLVQSDYRRYALRLGTESFGRGRIGLQNETKLCSILTDIAGRIALLDVERYRCVATAALRDAQNGKGVARRVSRASGLCVEIISGAEEGRLSRQAIAHTLGGVPKDALIVDIGGGSVEVGRASGRAFRSMPLGTLRVLSDFPELSSAMTQDQRDYVVSALCARMRTQLGALLRRPCVCAVGSGGNLQVLSRLLPGRAVAAPSIELKALAALMTTMGGMSVSERQRVYGLRRDRADVILPAALILEALRRSVGIEQFLVPGTGLREGVLYGLVESATERSRPSRHLGIERHARHLFDSLRPLHGLWAPAFALLQRAIQGKPAAPSSAHPLVVEVLRAARSTTGREAASRQATLLAGILLLATTPRLRDIRVLPRVDVWSKNVCIEYNGARPVRATRAAKLLSLGLARRVEVK